MSIYNVTRGQLAVLWLAGTVIDLIAWGVAFGNRKCVNVLRCKSGLFVDSTGWLVAAVLLGSFLIFYTIGWNNHHRNK